MEPSELIKKQITILRAIVDDEDVPTRPEMIIAVFQEVNKDLRMDRIQAEKNERKKQPATDKQIWYLNKNNIDFQPNITMGEAHELISKHKGNGN